MLRNLSCLEHLYNTSTKNVNSKKKNQWHVPQKTLLPTNLTQAYRKLFVLNDQNGLMPKTTLSHCMHANNCQIKEDNAWLLNLVNVNMFISSYFMTPISCNDDQGNRFWTCIRHKNCSKITFAIIKCYIHGLMVVIFTKITSNSLNVQIKCHNLKSRKHFIHDVKLFLKLNVFCFILLFEAHLFLQLNALLTLLLIKYVFSLCR